MKLKLIITLLLTANAIQAVTLNNDGKGEFHIIPFYTTTNGVDTIVTITNHASSRSYTPNVNFHVFGSVVKIHIKPSLDREPILSYQVYLAVNDSWSFGLGSQTVDSINKLLHGTFDRSCSQGLNQPLLVVNEINTTDLDHLGITSGYIEVIEMGQIDYDNSLHVDVFPNEYYYDDDHCQGLDDAFSEGGLYDFNSNSTYINEGLAPPNNSLTVESSLINVAKGIEFPVPVTTFSDFFPDNEIYHSSPNSSQPSLHLAEPKAVIWIDGIPKTLTFENSIDAVNALLMKTNLKTPFITFDGIAAATSISLTMPTLNLGNSSSNQSNICETAQPLPINVRMIDREGVTLPNNQVALELCGNAAILNFNEDRSIFSAQNEVILSPSHINQGVIAIDFPDLMTVHGTDDISGQQYTLSGIPVIGTTFNQATNANAAPGLLAQYGLSQPIKGTVQIASTEPNQE